MTVSQPSKDEIVSLALALQEVAMSADIGRKGLQFMCHQASKMIRSLRPGLNFLFEKETD